MVTTQDTTAHIRAHFIGEEIIEILPVFDEYVIVKYHPSGPVDRARNSWIRSDAVIYRDIIRYMVFRIDAAEPYGVFRPVETHTSLDAALVSAVAVKHDGINSKAAHYFMRSIT